MSFHNDIPLPKQPDKVNVKGSISCLFAFFQDYLLRNYKETAVEARKKETLAKLLYMESSQWQAVSFEESELLTFAQGNMVFAVAVLCLSNKVSYICCPLNHACVRSTSVSQPANDND
jgi:hypothetical protein